DVARRARVSIASVSRTLNNSSSVTPNVRARVLRAASRLHYTPHAGARSLIIRRTHTIGLLLPDIHGEYFSELIRGVDRAARARGYRAGLGAGRVARVIDGDFTEGSGYLAGRVLAASGTRPQAVFAANDMMAIGCLFALTEAGVRVPHDIALAGFDDIPLARFVSPPLTTVRVEVAEMGRRALESLIVAIADPEAA